MIEVTRLYQYNNKLLNYNGYLLGDVSVGTPAPVYPTADLLYRWSFDDSDYTDSADSLNLSAKGSGNSFTTGKVGNCLTLNGSGWAETASNMTGMVSGYTIAGWVKTSSKTGTPIIFRKFNDIIIWIVESNGYLHTYNGTGGWREITQPYNIADGNWHFFALTHTGTTGILYLDGQTPVSNTSYGSVSNTNYVGSWGSTATAQTPGQWLTGSLDNLYAYSSALSAADIALLYNSGSGA